MDPQNINKHTQAAVGYTDTKGTVYNETQTNTGCETQWDTNERYGMVYNQTLPVNCKYEIFLTLCRQFVAFFGGVVVVCLFYFVFFLVSFKGGPVATQKWLRKVLPSLTSVLSGQGHYFGDACCADRFQTKVV